MSWNKRRMDALAAIYDQELLKNPLDDFGTDSLQLSFDFTMTGRKPRIRRTVNPDMTNEERTAFRFRD